MMDTVWMDTRYAFRMLLKNPSFTVFAVIAMALGIGAVTAVFSIVDGVLLRPLPYREPERLMTLWETEPDVRWAPATIQDFLAWRQQTSVFTDLIAYGAMTLTLTTAKEPERVRACRVSPELFRMLGVSALRGRGLQPGDSNPNSEPVAVISERLWRSRFASTPDLVGKQVTLNKKIYSVMGIMPAIFQSPRKQIDVWLPLVPQIELAKPASHNLRVIGRLKAEVSVDHAQAEMDIIAKRLAMQFPDTNTGIGVRIVPLIDVLHEEIGPMLKIIFGAVALLLLITCVNLAGLLLVRVTNRQQEVSLRLAVGASRQRLIRQLLVESGVLSLIGGVSGILLAPALLRPMLLMVPERIATYVPNLENAAVNERVLAFSIFVSVITGILFGSVPAWRASRTDIHKNLKTTSFRNAGGRMQSRSHRLLVVTEFALSLVLLIAAGLLLRSFLLLKQRPLGFRPHNVITFSLSLPEASYPLDRDVAAFYGRLLREVRAIPGVQSAGAVSNLPLGASNSDIDIRVEGQPAAPPGQEIFTPYSTASPGYFQAMGIPLVQGREFNELDGAGRAAVAIIGESTARRFWPGSSALGKRIQLGGQDAWVQVVGVAKDVRWHEFDNYEVSKLYVYTPSEQHPDRELSIVLHSALEPRELAFGIRQAINRIDSGQSISALRTMEEVVEWANAPRRFNMVLMGIFALFALGLTAAGVYGIVAHSVASRKREVGIHVAVGATPAAILRMLLGEGARLALAGAAVGLIAGILLRRALRVLLYGVGPTDPLTIAASVIVLFLAASFASGVPAVRALRLDPAKTLRE
jgi:putative ABC transport system permease protein